MPQKKTFEVGLVMAGAVSAGAYTAGVMDYLLMAIDDWYQSKGKPGIPDHNICLKVMTGASAGGMTTAISTVELLHRAHQPEESRRAGYKSRMYQAWVEQIDISELLKTDDLQGGPIKSLLDSTILDQIARGIIDETKLPEWKGLPYVDEELKLFLTLSNLRGLPYDIKLSGETGLPHGMTDHSDYQYLKITKETKKSDWIKLRNAAIATGAFPIGLAPRLIERDMNEYVERIHKDGRDISALMKVKTSGNKPYNFVAVDGGLLNNEPIELAHSVWKKVTPEQKSKITDFEDVMRSRDEQEKKPADCPYALLIIDPFPDQVDLGKDATPEDATIMNIIGPIVGALRSQSLFKVEELIHAADEESQDRFLIAPIRYTETDDMALNAIACGFFAGFGGFMSKKFREHDYWLGRRNCQRFLKKYFTIPVEKARKEGWQIIDSYISADGKSYPIIPVVKGSRADQEQGKENPWPAYSRTEARVLKKQLTTRIQGLLRTMLPFGWTSKGWVTVAIVMLMLLTFAGEFVKAAQAQCGCMILMDGFKNSYILILQAIFFLSGVALIVLRLTKKSIARKLVIQAHKLLLSQMQRWGIEIK